MSEYWVVYRDIEGSEPRQSFEVMAAPQLGEPVVKSEILPGAPGKKEIYIRRNGRRIGIDESTYLPTPTRSLSLASLET